MNGLFLGAAVLVAGIPLSLRLARRAAPTTCPACRQSLTAGEPLPLEAVVRGVFECPTCGTRVDRRGRALRR